MGIDGGGSKTACAVGDEIMLLGRGVGGGSNLSRVAEAQAQTALETAIAEACRAAAVHPRHVRRTCVGIAGVSGSSTRETVRRVVGAIAGGQLEIVGDMEVAMEAAFGDSPGALVIAGTGSIAFARDSYGRTARAGGLGPPIADEGSGDWIGQRAVEAILHPEADRPCPVLETKIKEALGIEPGENLAGVRELVPKPNFAALFPKVLAAANAGEEIARCILTDAGIELAKLAVNAIRLLWSDSQWVRLAVTGGVFRHSRLVRQKFCGTLFNLRPKTAVSLSIIEPVVGALALARKGTLRK